jgi:hypothetical protein
MVSEASGAGHDRAAAPPMLSRAGLWAHFQGLPEGFKTAAQWT